MAGSFLPPVVAVLTASIGEFQAKMGEAKGEMAAVEGSASKMGVLGKTALVGLAAGAAVVTVESVKMASNFQSTMQLIATQAHAGQQEVDNMSKAVLALAPTVGIGPEKLAEGLYHVESTGLRGSAALDVMKASAQEAAIGLANFDDVTYAMSGVMSVALKDVANAADGVAYLNTIVGTGDMRMGDLAKAIGTGVLPVFKSAQLGMRDFGSAMAVMTDNSMPAEQAANHLKTAVMLLQNQSGPAAKALASIGIETGQLATDLAKPDGFLVAIQDIKTHLEESGKSAVEQGQIIAKAFGGARSAATIEEMIGQLDKLKGKYHEMDTVAGRARQQQEDWNATQQTFKQKMAEVGAQFQVWLIELGQKLLPVLSTFADWFMGSVKWLGDHKEVLIAIASGALPLLAYGIGLATFAVWDFTVALLANPITWIVLAFAALGVAIYEIVKHWDAIKKALAPAAKWLNDNVIQPIVRFFKGLWEDLKPTLEPIGRWFKDTFGEIVDWVKKNLPAIKETNRIVFEDLKKIIVPILQAIGEAFKTTFKIIGDVIGGIVDAVKGMIRTFTGIIEFVQGIFTGNWSKAWQGIKDIFGGAWDQITGLLKGAFKVVGDLFKGGWEYVNSVTGDFFNNLARGTAQGFTNLKNGVVDGWNKTMDFIRSIPGRVRDVFANAGDWLVTAGYNLLVGLYNGIVGAMGWLRDKVTSWASGLVNGIKSAFGIASPSTIFHEMGGFLVQGLANGIDEHAHLAVQAANAMATKVFGGASGSIGINGSMSMTGSGGLAGGVGAAAGTTVINQITVQGSVVAERDLQTLVQTLTLQYGNRNSSNGLAVVR